MAAQKKFPLQAFCILLLVLTACGANRGKTRSAPTPLAVPDADVAPLLAMYSRAVQLASNQTPALVLHQVDTNLEWTVFRFTNATASEEIAIQVNTPTTPSANWIVDVSTDSKLVGIQAPGLDMTKLKAGPKRAAQAILTYWRGCKLTGLTLYLLDGHLTWATFCKTSSGMLTGVMDNQTGVFRPTSSTSAGSATATSAP